MRAGTVLALAALALACEEPPPPPVAVVDVWVPALGGAASGEAPAVEPASAQVAVEERAPGRWAIAYRSREPVSVGTSDTCPISLGPSGSVARDAPVETLDGLYRIVGAGAPLGFGEPFELTVDDVCTTLTDATFAWQNDGWPIADLEIDGSTVRGRMPTLPRTRDEPGVVAISPRTRGTLTLTLVVTAPDGEVLRREEVQLHAAARATGMPSVPVDVAVYVKGGETITGPPNGTAPVFEVVGGGVHRFVARSSGRYLVSDAQGEHVLSLFAGSHAATPLDCGRAECHANETARARESPMTTVFSRLVEDESYTPGCAMGCHTAGEPGTEDGGFVHVATELGEYAPAHGAPGAYEALPRPLRRLSGVGCTSCHGPGAIPEPSARTRILRTDVCASCHDAPPRYGHVAAFYANRMSRAGRADGIDREPRCAGCHTTDGFLHGTTTADGSPREIAMEGLGCATCHGPHDEDPGPALLRTRPLPAILEGVESSVTEHPSRICTGCHAPDAGFDLPLASATALVVGRGGLDAAGGALEVSAPHAELGGGCLACHGSAQADVERGGGHTFAVSPAVCESCHEGRDFGQERAALRARALSLFERAGPASSRGEAQPGAPSSPRARARWNVALVRFDRGAHAHAGSGATELLDAAEAMLGSF